MKARLPRSLAVTLLTSPPALLGYVLVLLYEPEPLTAYCLGGVAGLLWVGAQVIYLATHEEGREP